MFGHGLCTSLCQPFPIPFCSTPFAPLSTAASRYFGRRALSLASVVIISLFCGLLVYGRNTRQQCARLSKFSMDGSIRRPKFCPETYAMKDASEMRPDRHIGRLGAGPLPRHHGHPTTGLTLRKDFGTTLPETNSEQGLLIKRSMKRGPHSTYAHGEYVSLVDGEAGDVDEQEASDAENKREARSVQPGFSKDGHPLFKLDAKNKPRRNTGY
mmetsp:Transcript_30206/g.61537  ORF Transcript_30206/g.61537 Transcript_30206/m.61537 type:complete len:212 (+) Transcript_30206:147-782(+)